MRNDIKTNQKYIGSYLPSQDVPEPLKPDLQAHVKPPFVLVQSALG